MEASGGSSPDQSKSAPWWQNRWAVLVAALALGGGLNLADDLGFGGVFEWSVAFTLGTGLAIAVFWQRRASRWYWPAVAFLVVVHLAALVLHPWHMLPYTATGLAIELKGAAGGDFAASAIFLYLLHLLLDPEAGPWTHTTKFVVAAVILFNIGIFGIGALVLVEAHNSKVASLRLVFQGQSAQPMQRLMECIDSYRSDNDQWDDPGVGAPAREMLNPAGMRVRIIDRHSARTVQVETVDGRSLHQYESKLLRRCVGSTSATGGSGS